MRVLVCGGRDYADYGRLSAVLSAAHGRNPVSVIIHGAARGADLLAARWAENHAVPADAYPANWNRDGRAAGPLRNIRMLAEGKPDIVVAFPGGKGTAHMCKIARDGGFEVVTIT